MRTISLQPDPRILEVLGQIELKGWQVIAELVDNSIDGILAQANENDYNLIEIFVPAPREIEEMRKVRISDNGSGMNENELEKALRAGFSGRSKAGDLGLFGVGFNIATARIGSKAIIWTSKKDMDHDIGVIIDIQEMKESGSFERELTTRKNSDTAGLDKSGTSIEITEYYPRAKTLLYFRDRLKKSLDAAYSASFLKRNNLIIKFNDRPLKPRSFCTWGENRLGSYGGEDYPVIQRFDNTLNELWFCTECIRYYDESDDKPLCIQCNSSNEIIKKPIRVDGWVGLQRYFHHDDYGIDIIRNGRVIISRSKKLFTWINRDERGDGLDQFEYPKDSMALGGRIVGEMHVDFLLPTYTKDSFVEDDNWWEAVAVVRGIQPLQPELATKRYKFPKNQSPLAKIFYPFRYKKAGSGAMYPTNIDGSGANHICLEYSEHFYAGNKDYEDDTKWWELIEKYENRKGEIDNPLPDPVSPETPETPPTDPNQDDTSFKGSKIFDRQIEFVLDENPSINAIKVDVKKYIPHPDEIMLVPLILLPKRPNVFECLINSKHKIFNTFPETWEDLLIMDVSNKMLNNYRLHLDEEDWNFSRIFYLLKKKYNPQGLLGINDLNTTAINIIKEMQNHLIDHDYELSKRPSLSKKYQNQLKQNYLDMENKKLNNISLITNKTSFLKYLGQRYVTEFLQDYFYLLTDDIYFSIPYNNLTDDKEQQISQEAKIIGYINDLTYSAYILPEMTDQQQMSNKLELIRCSASLQMLTNLKIVN